MLGEFHVRGYPRLRMAPSGMHWRCTIAPVQNVLRANGARMGSWDTVTAHYTSADERRYVGWSDAAHASPSRLAELFIERFSVVAAAGCGVDCLYAGWYQHMMHWTYPNALPIAYTDG